MFRLKITNGRNGDGTNHAINPFKPSKPINQTNYLYRRNQSNIALNRENSKYSVTLGSRTPTNKIFVNIQKNGLPVINYPRAQTSVNLRSKPSSARSSNREQENSIKSQQDCTCILCLNKLLTSRKKAKTSMDKNMDHWAVDSKHFLETLDQIRMSVKINRDYEMNNGLNGSNQKLDSQRSDSKMRYLHKSSRIKLWKPSEIDKWASSFNLESSEFDTDSNDIIENLSKDSSSSSLKQRDIIVNNDFNEESVTNQNDFDYPSNPPASPLSFYRIPIALPMDD
ncbi:unnamed protein product [Brachionus calyciflorus]|uniref:Uncharacterized protein n=1 Tax=Brachionus calyciflorus TaxID=104777 RepID=A0A814H960_9BILA|nr:unnamed protein product [Brachionus calyciflorus]